MFSGNYVMSYEYSSFIVYIDSATLRIVRVSGCRIKANVAKGPCGSTSPTRKIDRCCIDLNHGIWKRPGMVIAYSG